MFVEMGFYPVGSLGHEQDDGAKVPTPDRPQLRQVAADGFRGPVGK